MTAVKVIITTGYHRDLAERRDGRTHTMLQKPIATEHLLAAVRTSLDGH